MSLLVALAVGFLFGTSSMASAQWTKTVGGGGGGAYTFDCGSVPLTSMNIRAGSYIDAIQPICWNGSVSPWIGGGGGGADNLQCAISTDYNRAMRGVNLYSGWVVNAMQGFCESMGSNGTNSTKWVGTKSGTYTSLKCPQYRGIKQLKGGAGLYLDSISVYCGDY
jgi:hypothetical protein